MEANLEAMNSEEEQKTLLGIKERPDVIIGLQQRADETTKD